MTNGTDSKKKILICRIKPDYIEVKDESLEGVMDSWACSFTAELTKHGPRKR